LRICIRSPLALADEAAFAPSSPASAATTVCTQAKYHYTYVYINIHMHFYIQKIHTNTHIIMLLAPHLRLLQQLHVFAATTACVCVRVYTNTHTLLHILYIEQAHWSLHLLANPFCHSCYNYTHTHTHTHTHTQRHRHRHTHTHKLYT